MTAILRYELKETRQAHANENLQRGLLACACMDGEKGWIPATPGRAIRLAESNACCDICKLPFTTEIKMVAVPVEYGLDKLAVF